MSRPYQTTVCGVGSAGMGHFAATAMGAGAYFAEHDERDRQVAEALGGYYVKGGGDGAADIHYFGRALDALGIEGDVSPERTTALVSETWTQLRHPETGEALGTALRHYAGAAEKPGQIAAKFGLSGAKHRIGGQGGPIDHAFSPAYRRSAVLDAGASTPRSCPTKTANWTSACERTVACVASHRGQVHLVRARKPQGFGEADVQLRLLQIPDVASTSRLLAHAPVGATGVDCGPDLDHADQP